MGVDDNVLQVAVHYVVVLLLLLLDGLLTRLRGLNPLDDLLYYHLYLACLHVQCQQLLVINPLDEQPAHELESAFCCIPHAWEVEHTRVFVVHERLRQLEEELLLLGVFL